MHWRSERMLQKTKQGFYQLIELNNLGLKHGFSTVSMGDMRSNDHVDCDNLKNFVYQIDSQYQAVVGMEQVHGTNVELVGISNRNSLQNRTDGLITMEKGLFLNIKTADCLPVIFFDKYKQIVGAAHAGYKGIYANISRFVINKMLRLGSDPAKINVAIGPSIRECCYFITEERANMFKQQYPPSIGYLTYKQGKPFLSLQNLLKWQLITAGVPQENIFDAMMCTQDHSSEFFSFRAKNKDDKNLRFATIVGL